VAGTAWNRFTPANETGETRSAKTGSVSTRKPSVSISRVLCPSHVTRRPDAGTGAAHAARGLSTGIGAGGRRPRRPNRKSQAIPGRALSRPGPTGAVLWNVPSRNCLDARARSRRAPVMLGMGRT
jgi:hypothetical protein